MPGPTRQACWLALLLCLTFGSVYNQDCDVLIESSSASIPTQGVFQSPGWPQKYPLGKHCTYKFIGTSSQRVQIKFTKFNLQGVFPLCKFDYLDIYIEIKSNSESLMESSLLGRFCGDGLHHLPKLIRSTGNIIVLDFYSDSRKSYQGFNGSYEFIDASIYNIGTRIGTNSCSYMLDGAMKRSGYIISPTYPAVYPDNLRCTYQLVGRPGQRVKLTLVDFSLFHGADYCPFDYVAVYDGNKNSMPLIRKFCGNYKNVTTLYSSRENLYIEFVTQSGRVDFRSESLYDNVDFSSERRGFNMTYEFSDAFVRIEYNTSNMEHVLGTLCDVRITSRKESNGTITSPMYPQRFPKNLICRYYIDGLSNLNNLEKVKVSFQDFEIPGDKPNCDSGFLAVNLKGTESAGAVDEKFCGLLLPPDLTSKDPRLVLILDTYGSTWGRGFSATYQFLKDFDIPGKQIVPNKCIFLYDSAELKKGSFNSPRHVGNYRGDVECTYIFRPVHGSGEKLLISFLSFSMGNSTPDPECPNTDYLLINEKDPTQKQHYVPIKRYCGGKFFPGPILGNRGMQIVFHSHRKSRIASFEAIYEFIPKTRLKSHFEEYIHSDSTGGIIKSPGYPEKYKSYSFCNWTIKASKRTNKILLQFFYFHTEGKSKKLQSDTKEGTSDDSASLGCQNAVMRLYRNANTPPQELCGSLNGQFYLSTNDTVRLEFLTSSRALGAKGFKITWTEVHEDKGPCYGFKCAKSHYCISSKLKCNGLPNCGSDDTSDEKCTYDELNPESDEQKSGPNTAGFQIVHLAIGASISSFFCIILVVCGLLVFHRKRLRPNRKPPDNNHVEVRYVAASSSCNTTDRLLAIDNLDELDNKPDCSSPTTPTPHTPNQTTKLIHNNPTLPVQAQNKTSALSHNKSSYDSPNQSPSIAKVKSSYNSPNQSPSIATVNRTSARAPRIQKISIV